MYKKLGLALAFSPTCAALLAEASRLQKLYKSELILIHVGIKDEENELRMNEYIRQAGMRTEAVTVVWKLGKPARVIIKTCRKYQIDLLIAGALRKENLINYYIGSIARKIIRKAPCSVLIFTEPSTLGKKINRMLIDVENTPLLSKVIEVGLQQARMRKVSFIHFVREMKLYGLSMSVLSEYSMDELSDHRKNLIEQEIKRIDKRLEKYDLTGFRKRIKILTGKAGYELRKYARKSDIDLMVIGALENKLSFVDRLFMNNLEFIVEDIPCNLLIVKSLE